MNRFMAGAAACVLFSITAVSWQRESGTVAPNQLHAIDAKTVVEIGTSTGISGLWFCMALQRTGGKLTTYEIDKRRAGLARAHFAKAGVE